MPKNKGFSLIELLIVVAIILVIAALFSARKGASSGAAVCKGAATAGAPHMAEIVSAITMLRIVRSV